MSMHDLTDDDRARLKEIAHFIEREHPQIHRLGDAVFLRKLAEQSSGDQGLRITDEMIELAAREQWELSGPDSDHEVAPKKDHPGGWEQAGNGAQFLYRGNALRVLEAALSDSTDNPQED